MKKYINWLSAGDAVIHTSHHRWRFYFFYVNIRKRQHRPQLHSKRMTKIYTLAWRDDVYDTRLISCLEHFSVLGKYGKPPLHCATKISRHKTRFPPQCIRMCVMCVNVSSLMPNAIYIHINRLWNSLSSAPFVCVSPKRVAFVVSILPNLGAIPIW